MLKIFQDDRFDQLEEVFGCSFWHHLGQLDVAIVYFRIVVWIVAIHFQFLYEDFGAGQAPDTFAAATIFLWQTASVAIARTTAILPSSLRHNKTPIQQTVQWMALQALAAILTHHLFRAFLAFGRRRWLLHHIGRRMFAIFGAIAVLAIGLPIQLLDN